jgi:hypothetical protein
MYRWKESRIGLGRICRPPTKVLPRDRTTSATSRMIALLEGAIRQIRHTGLPDEAGSDSVAACGPGRRKPQK